jgi:hypothetical protein
MLEVEESWIFVVDHCRSLLGFGARLKGDLRLQTATGRSESAMLHTRRADKGSKCS